MKRLCEEVDKPTMNPLLRRQLGRVMVHSELRAFATAFVHLQQQRHQADYDPHTQLLHADAVDAVSVAEQGIDALARSPSDERTDFLALLLASARG